MEVKDIVDKRKRSLNEYVRYGYRILLGLFFRMKLDQGGSMLRVCGRVIVSKAKNSKLIIGKNVILHKDIGIYLESGKAKIEIGDHTFINRRSEIRCKEQVKIGSHCAISWDVSIIDTDYHQLIGTESTKPVFIGNKVWIGCKSTILKGITIGDGAVVAAGSVVTKDVAPCTLVAGVPAKEVKRNVEWSL